MLFYYFAGHLNARTDTWWRPQATTVSSTATLLDRRVIRTALAMPPGTSMVMA